MYSYEIDNFLKFKNYELYIDDYLKYINVKDSPQINNIRFSPFGNYFQVTTDDGYSWTIKIRR